MVVRPPQTLRDVLISCRSAELGRFRPGDKDRDKFKRWDEMRFNFLQFFNSFQFSDLFCFNFQFSQDEMRFNFKIENCLQFQWFSYLGKIDKADDWIQFNCSDSGRSDLFVTWVTWRLLWLLRASETTASIRGWRVARIWEMMALWLTVDLWQTSLGTVRHCCWGTVWQLWLGTAWQDWRGTIWHSWSETVWHCCFGTLWHFWVLMNLSLKFYKDRSFRCRDICKTIRNLFNP